jgi:predicted ATP-dependent endonuclease of OLD family
MLGTEPFDQCCPPTNSGARHASSTVTIRRVRAHRQSTARCWSRPIRRTRSQTAEAFVARAVVLVEGISDQVALEALAERRGRNLDAEGVSVVPIGGAQAIGSFLERFGPQGFDVRLAGLCDAAEEGHFRRGLERAGLGSDLTRAGMEALGFYVCVEDLEDELIRSLGAATVERVIDAAGDLEAFRTLQKQPAWRGRAKEEQLRRWFGSHGGKIQYARLLVGALDLTRVPRPLDRVLAQV